jgi:hypothetical protein
MEREELKQGMKVYFGRERGEHTLGEVVKINTTSISVRQLEARGTHPVGTIWRVSHRLLQAAGAGSPASIQATPAAPTKDTQSTSRTLPQEFTVGQEVCFRTSRTGAWTRGRVTKVNPKNLQIMQLEDRPVRRAGTMWSIPPAMCTPYGGAKTGEAERPVLVNILTGERLVGHAGETAESHFERTYS